MGIIHILSFSSIVHWYQFSKTFFFFFASEDLHPKNSISFTNVNLLNLYVKIDKAFEGQVALGQLKHKII